MLKSISIENFFSFGKPQKIEMNPGVNILIGINGSGKSNFLRAIRLLWEGIVGNGFEKIFLQKWGGFFSISNASYNIDYIQFRYEFDKDFINKTVNGHQFKSNPTYEITIWPSGKSNGGNSAYYLEEKVFAKDQRQEGEDFLYLKIKNGKGRISTREDETINLQYYPNPENNLSFKTQELVLRQISDPERFYPLFTLKRGIEGLNVYESFDTSFESKLREAAPYSLENFLLNDGSNLIPLLNRLKVNNSNKFDQLEKQFKEVNPHYRDIIFELVSGNRTMLYVREEKLSRAIQINLLSDGTLNFLLLLTIFYNPNRGQLIGIDEPEMGLHPDMTHIVSRAIQEAAHTSQMIIATHSPLLLNEFEIEDLLIFEKDADNQTVVRFKTEEELGDWMENYLPGQLWMSGKLGAKRW